MSGRGAYARKKNTETHKKNQAGVSSSNSSGKRPTSSVPSDHDDISIRDFPLPPPGPLGTGVGTTNARFLKFSEPAQDPRMAGWAGGGVSPQGMMAVGRDGYAMPVPGADEWAYGRQQRKPTIKTEDVSGIEKSGLRSLIDKRSDGVRKGLAKTFAFRKKDKEETGRPGSYERPQSQATVRQTAYMPAMGPTEDAARGYDDWSPTGPVPSQQMPMSYAGYPTYPPHAHPHINPHALPSPISPMEAMPTPVWETNPIGPPPTTKLPPIPQATASTPPIFRWMGAGRPAARWNKLRKDPELWDPNGDVLIFLGRKGQTPRLHPSFRLSSHIIEATESRFLITLLREGSNEEDIMHLPPSPSGAPPMVRRGTTRDRNKPLTPPTSEDASQTDDQDGQISYEMYFPTPANLSRADALRHQLTTRNVFALLCHASLVGLSMHQALTDLHTRLDSYMPPGADNAARIIKFLATRGLDDVRGDPEGAVSLLAWAEASEVRWEDGWRECFVHCAGMYGSVADLERCADWRHTTPIARALLDRASLETQLRVQAAEERLAEFAFGDMWPETVAPVLAGAAERLRLMLRSHYARVYGSWPPPRDDEDDGGELGMVDEMWLSRSIVMALQRDFGALYDYLVDRDIVWDVSEARSGRKWMMASESGNRAFEADTPELPLTDVLIEFDNRLRFPHIPHPFPLIPESIPPTTAPKEGLFKSKAKPAAGAKPVGAMERRVQLAYTESTNIYSLGSDFVPSALVDAYVRFEKADRVGEIDPAIARRGRWVLLYGILQTLASVSVDDPNVRYTDGVTYHLSPRLRGSRIPPWRGPGAPSRSLGEASHELSHCWTAGAGWTRDGRPDSDVMEGDLAGSPPVVGGPMMPMRRGREPGGEWSSGTGSGGGDTPGTRSVTSFVSGA